MKKDTTEVYLSAKMSDLDVTSLAKWVVEGEPASAQINLVAGKTAVAFIFSDVLVAFYSQGGDIVSFSLNFKEVKRFPFSMSFP